jgi:hypothetical protein
MGMRNVSYRVELVTSADSTDRRLDMRAIHPRNAFLSSLPRAV